MATFKVYKDKPRKNCGFTEQKRFRSSREIKDYLDKLSRKEVLLKSFFIRRCGKLNDNFPYILYIKV